MNMSAKIRALSRRIAAEFRPERIILFGSHAHGRATTDSDVDLLVVMPFKGKGVHKSVEILNRVEPEFPVDVIVRTPSQLRKRLAASDYFFDEIVRNGKVLYEATHP
ncbi:MAG: nucleotidyltransferase domain-containing protein [Betaproteobacteria bacterium]|nr:nucleotidyltransferase domain-containing protein [Betaproteobacteria bacterium]